MWKQYLETRKNLTPKLCNKCPWKRYSVSCQPYCYLSSGNCYFGEQFIYL